MNAIVEQANTRQICNCCCARQGTVSYQTLGVYMCCICIIFACVGVCVYVFFFLPQRTGSGVEVATENKKNQATNLLIIVITLRLVAVVPEIHSLESRYLFTPILPLLQISKRNLK